MADDYKLYKSDFVCDSCGAEWKDKDAAKIFYGLADGREAARVSFCPLCGEKKKIPLELIAESVNNAYRPPVPRARYHVNGPDSVKIARRDRWKGINAEELALAERTAMEQAARDRLREAEIVAAREKAIMLAAKNRVRRLGFEIDVIKERLEIAVGEERVRLEKILAAAEVELSYLLEGSND